ncbi:hypothetical protein ZHAS_00019577 [Anopheles sinensis]|uniref:Uncharacterized protein n=1 Tax=Anopheles sinensis TaxID=74873 RepID=A0A084WMS2_ANOSI|nr:hypothetical protein ZHAS_00019577 [Anopheles sinensis]
MADGWSEEKFTVLWPERHQATDGRTGGLCCASERALAHIKQTLNSADTAHCSDAATTNTTSLLSAERSGSRSMNSRWENVGLYPAH